MCNATPICTWVAAPPRVSTRSIYRKEQDGGSRERHAIKTLRNALSPPFPSPGSAPR
ncbi:hypothetical protein NPIL_632771, partial [Nephila pilipes]